MFLPIGLMVAYSREVVRIQGKSNRAALVKNVSVPNPTDYNFACLILEHDVGELAGCRTKDVSFPLVDLPTGKARQFLFFANSCCYISDGCRCLAVVVDRDDQNLSA